jgi:hypothetical protein
MNWDAVINGKAIKPNLSAESVRIICRNSKTIAFEYS